MADLQVIMKDNSKPKQIVTITEKAANEIKRALEQKNDPELGVRVGVQGGGCSGLSYKIDYDKAGERDHIIEMFDVKIIVDRKSAIYLKGMQVDFNDSLSSRGFVFKNPNATNTCGCGESFSV